MSEPPGVDPAAWQRARAPLWRALAAEVEAAPSRTQATLPEAQRTLLAYRALARDLSTARELVPGAAAATALASAYARLHVAINRTPRHGSRRWRLLFSEGIPRAAASVRTWCFWIVLLFAASTFAGWWLVMTYPDLVSLFASEQMIDEVDHGRLWTDGILNIAPSSVVSLNIFSNNVVVTAGAFCAGLFFGLGTLYMISVNGLMLGGSLAFTHQHGLGGALLKFILAHGPVELSVIFLAGAAGTALGEALVRPTLFSRAESFRRRAGQLAPLLVACVLLLLGSGLIEGFISPDPRFSVPVRISVGLGYWILMLLLLSGRLWPRGARPAATGTVSPH